MLTAIIVDDEVPGIESLQILLKKYCPSVKVTDVANSIDEAEVKIASLNPDIVFLDIEMPGGNGFEVLKRLKNISFNIIFTTAHDRYAIKAIKHSALDYLLKPIDPDELIGAIKKCEETKKKGTHTYQPEKIEALFDAFNQTKKIQKLPVKTMDGVIFVNLKEVVRLEAHSNYTSIFLITGKKIVASKTLKEFEDLLIGVNFFRIHNTHLINLAYVDKYIKGEGGSLIMSDSSEVEVSRTKKIELLSLLSLK
ncbi:MAG TPA: LytTR family DNA-binding domain-containing protein [Bacteroidia bacterium]|jgi:two-component system LytT family response regulator|nr:LytTR family DNA-binding domain-containing protein [Bacteroidia bacterium]